MAWCLGLGLLTTIGIAWGLAARGAYGWGWSERSGARLRDPARGEDAGEIRAHLFAGPGWRIAEGVARDLTYFPEDQPVPTPDSAIPRWARRAVLPWPAGSSPWPAPQRGERRVARGTGWPLIALWHEYRWLPKPGAGPPYGDYLTPGGIRIEPNRGNPGAWPVDYPRALPCRPVWFGLAADTAIHASLWWVLLSTPGMVRRRRRRRAGRCPRCAYDLAGLPDDSNCPECGLERRPKPTP